MGKPLLLDVFSGAGGAARGYMDAGFYVVGVDSAPQPHYCGNEFIQADALTFLDTADLAQYSVIHASPPCQGYSTLRALAKASMRTMREYPLLIAAVRSRLEVSGVPWVIENVAFSAIPDALILCGSLFGLQVRRHRWFACSHVLFSPGPVIRPTFIGVYGNNVRGYGSLRTNFRYRKADGSSAFREKTLTKAQGQAAMGIDWMTVRELCQAIPPAYTAWIGAQLIECLKMEREVAA